MRAALVPPPLCHNCSGASLGALGTPVSPLSASGKPLLSSRKTSPEVSPLLTRHRLLDNWHEEPLASQPAVPVDGSGLPDFALLEDGDAADVMTVGESIFNLVNLMVGSGVLSIPYAFRLSGYVALPLLGAVVAVTAFTASLVGDALDLAASMPGTSEVPRQSRDYVFLAEVAFGLRGRACVRVVAMLELWLAIMTLLVMNGMNADLLFHVGPRAAIVACASTALLMSRIPMRLYAYISLASLVILLGASAAFVTYLMQLELWACPAATRPPSGSGGIPRSIGIMLFCFAGHPCFPSVHEHMRETWRWHESVGVSFAVSMLYYGGLGLLAYRALGTALEPSFVLNISEESPWHSITTLLFLLKVQLTLPLMLRAILVGTELAAGPRGGSLLLVAVTAMGACLFARDVAALATLCGSLLVMLTSVLIPVAVYLRLWSLKRSPESGGATALLLLLTCTVAVLFGCCAGVSGTYFALTDLASGKV